MESRIKASCRSLYVAPVYFLMLMAGYHADTLKGALFVFTTPAVFLYLAVKTHRHLREVNIKRVELRKKFLAGH